METPDYVIGQTYLITCKTTNKQYVGQTASHQWRTVRNRWVVYGYEERFKQHIRNTATYEKFSRCRALNSAMLKYGTEDFTVDLLEECPLESLDEVEIMYISELNTLSPNGYNLETGGNKNKRACKETREKQTESRIKFYASDAGKAFKVTHGANLAKFNTSNNDKKKIDKFKDRNIDRIHISNCVSESQVYLYIYCDGKKKELKARFKYTVHNDEFILRVRTIIEGIKNNRQFNITGEI